ncbi:MAG: hypothetical protein IJ875_07610, partial [Solobacterium sp.]|nr:hypothetical protein [Solobacterium sp.]
MKHKKRLRKIVALLLALMLLLSSFLQLLAQKEMIEIRTYEDLLSIEKNPNGYYILQNDIDLEGKSWTPFPFSGTLNGNHHALLNLKIENIGKETHLTYDGNYKTYDTQFSGLFSHIENADIRHLSFYNVDIVLTTDTPTYVGTIAGYNENSTIQDCHIEGRIELHNRSAAHGIGGICGQ